MNPLMNISHKVIVACMVGGTMVTVAFFAATDKKGDVPNTPAEPVAARNIIGERPYIPENDSDGDGIPDWKETLDVIEPIAMEEILALASSTSASSSEPETLTDEVAVRVMSRVLEAKRDGAEADMVIDSIIRAEMLELQVESRQMAYGKSDISAFNNAAPEDIHAYVNQLANITLTYPLPEGTKHELAILQEALVSRNTVDFEEFNPIIDSYTKIVEQTAATPVPAEFATLHVDLLNAYDAILTDITAMKNLPEDPVLAMVRIKRYEEDLSGLYNVLVEMGRLARTKAMSEFTPEDPVFVAFSFVLKDL